MNTLRLASLSPVSAVAVLLPLALWAALWFSLASGPGNIQGIIHPGSPVGFLHGLRAIFPIVAAAGAILIILAGVSQQGPRTYLLLGPLGLAAVYGLVGLASSLLSPNKLVALYWAAAYLSVPLVLLAIVRGANATGHLSRLINLNWLLVMVLLGASVLFVIARGYLDIGALASDPSALLGCKLGDSWFKATGGVLRQTGMGRYAAVAALIALAGLWRGSWRPLWSLVLLGSLALLLASGARTAWVGFTAAAVFVVLLYEGKRAVVVGSAVLIVLVPLVWSTGAHQPFLDTCILRGYPTLVSPQKPAAVAVESSAPVPPPAAAVESSAQVPPPAAAAESSAQVLPPAAAVESSAQVPPPAVAAESSAQVPPPAAAVESSAQVLPPAAAVESSAPVTPPAPAETPKGFFTFTGRTVVWAEGWKLFTASPLLGFGFHADRLKLGHHMHNSFLHAMVQTGLVGTIPFVAALLLGWGLLLKALRNLPRLPGSHKHLVIQTAGVLAFLTLRSIPESTGAFFGVDWLLLAPLLLYLQVVNHSRVKEGGET